MEHNADNSQRHDRKDTLNEDSYMSFVDPNQTQKHEHSSTFAKPKELGGVREQMRSIKVMP